MDTVNILARWGALGYLAALLVVIVYKVLIGTISLQGLLTAQRKDGTQYFSLGRTQLVALTLISAVIYVKQVAANPSMGALPPVRDTVLGLLGGSQVFYLAGKARALLIGTAATSSPKDTTK